MLEKNMLVDDGWTVVEPFRHKTGAEATVRISKHGNRLYLNVAAWAHALAGPIADRTIKEDAHA